MAGIYIHIPFCKRKCHYCNFFSVASERLRAGFMEALKEEAVAQKGYLEKETIRTVYIGGGTPSLLKADELEGILSVIFSQYPVDPEAEITVEMNPDDASRQLLREYRHLPLNRISLGVQSFNDNDLKTLDRLHDGRKAKNALENILGSGYKNVSIDLIYGIPGSSVHSWAKNLEIFMDYRLPHLSAYALTVEENTAMRWMIRKGRMPLPDEERMADQYSVLAETMEQHGYVHYEISNHAKKGWYSKHNSLYWLGGHYLGLGPSAHSYNGHSRQWNPCSIHQYRQVADYREMTREKEVLSEEEKFNEYVLTSLRTVWGCDTAHIRNVFGDAFVKHFTNRVGKYLSQGLVVSKESNYYLTGRGKLLADGIISDIFLG